MSAIAIEAAGSAQHHPSRKTADIHDAHIRSPIRAFARFPHRG
jgi:hypothetical protein